jgi:hypothetical protein
MKIVLLLLSCLLSNLVFCQTTKIDKITGDTSMYSGFEKLYSKASFSGTVGEQLKVIISRNKDGYKLGIWIQTAKSLSYNVEPGGMMRIKCKDGTIINLTAIGTGANDVADNLSGSSSIILFPLDENTLMSLLEKAIVFIRIEGTPGYLEYDIKEKFSSTISNCIKVIKI